MSLASETRVISTHDLKVLWRKAGPGKRPAKQFIDSLDPQGTHTLHVLLPFHNDGFEHRCRGFAKVPDQVEGVMFELDVLVKDFESLQTAEQFLAQPEEV